MIFSHETFAAAAVTAADSLVRRALSTRPVRPARRLRRSQNTIASTMMPTTTTPTGLSNVSPNARSGPTRSPAPPPEIASHSNRIC